MAYEVILVSEAQQDIDDAISWYEAQQLNLGIRFYFEILECLKKIETHPQHYGYFQKDYRQCLVKSFPYKIVFKTIMNSIVVLAVFHSGRSADELRNRI
jgi:plasmid stabilization system protein ParE